MSFPLSDYHRFRQASVNYGNQCDEAAEREEREEDLAEYIELHPEEKAAEAEYLKMLNLTNTSGG